MPRLQHEAQAERLLPGVPHRAAIIRIGSGSNVLTSAPRHAIIETVASRVVFCPAMDDTVPPSTLNAALAELVSLGMRASRVVTRMMEIELLAAEIVASWLPEPTGPATSASEAFAIGQGVDSANAAMADAVPRTEILARALDRTTRSVRRSVALIRRIEAGWPHAGSVSARADDQAAMLRRQVARGVGEAIRQQADGETAERLFDDLAERLHDPGLEAEIGATPVEQVVRRICRELGLVTAALEAQLPHRGTGEPPVVDTG